MYAVFRRLTFMLKRTSAIFFFLGLICLSTALIAIANDQKNIFIIGTLLAAFFALLGFAFKAIHAGNAAQRKTKSVFLVVAICLLVLGVVSRLTDTPGGRLEVIFAVLFYCFGYAPIELYLKKERWSAYSNNRWEMFLLSALDFLGVNLVLLGALSVYMDWPGKFYLIYPGCALLIVGIVSWNSRFKQEVIRRKKSEDQIKIQYQEIEKEKAISDGLLRNILPAEVAEELKTKGSADARQFDEVTVLFTDFKDFTRLAEQMSATELVEEINTCFVAFDKIMEKYGIEKIKTIGDSYMCAGGLPLANNTHAADVVNAALEIQQFIQDRIKERAAAGQDAFQIRIGIHTGPVVAGIVGIKKFAYDIWGDTVNTASRMESSGETGRVNISGTTYAMVKDLFKCVHRGKISAKGKGEVEMYFVEGRI